MNNEQVYFYSQNQEGVIEITQQVRRRRRNLIARVLVAALLMLVIPLAAPPAFAGDLSDFTDPDNKYEGNQAGVSYTVVYKAEGVVDGDVGATVTISATAIPGANPGQPTINGVACCSPVTATTDGSETVTFTVNSTNEGVTTLTARVADPFANNDQATAQWGVCDPNVGTDPPTFPFDIARDAEFFNDCDGWVLDGFGGVHPVGNADAAEGLPYFAGFDIARELVPVINVTGEAVGGYILDGWGGVHPFKTSGNPTPPTASGLPYFPGFDIARDVHLSDPSGPDGWLLDGFGGMHPLGSAATLTGLPYFGFDIAREIAFAPGEDDGTSGGYVLDGFGGMHPFGGKPALAGLPYFAGNDVAQDALLSGADDGYMLDAYGGIHDFGSAPDATTSLPYTGGVDNYKAFDLMDNHGLVVNRFGSLFEWFS